VKFNYEHIGSSACHMQTDVIRHCLKNNTTVLCWYHVHI